MSSCLHPGRLTWNLQITHLERKMIFQTSMIMVHVNLRGCTFNHHFQPSTTARSARFWRSGCLWCTFQWGHHFDTTWRSQSWKTASGGIPCQMLRIHFLDPMGLGKLLSLEIFLLLKWERHNIRVDFFKWHLSTCEGNRVDMKLSICHWCWWIFC